MKSFKAQARRKFAREIEQENFDLTRAAVLIAEEEDANPNRAFEFWREMDELTEDAREFFVNRDLSVTAFNVWMFDRQGFYGNTRSYYDSRNSLLPSVLERRTGIPITLAILYIEFARRLGISAEGIGFPGHFLIRVGAGESGNAVLVDAFHGRLINEGECQTRLAEMSGGSMILMPQHLRAVTNREIIVRVLQNLKGIYIGAEMHKQAIAVVERILLAAPQMSGELKDLGVLQAQTGAFVEAIKTLESYLAHQPPDKSEIEDFIKSLRLRHAQRN